MRIRRETVYMTSELIDDSLTVFATIELKPIVLRILSTGKKTMVISSATLASKTHTRGASLNSQYLFSTRNNNSRKTPTAQIQPTKCLHRT